MSSTSDRRSEPGLDLGAQRRELASGYPAVGDEGSLRGAEPPDRVEPFELPGDARAQVPEPLDMRRQQCPRWSSAAAIACGRSARRRSIASTAACSERCSKASGSAAWRT